MKSLSKIISDENKRKEIYNYLIYKYYDCKSKNISFIIDPYILMKELNDYKAVRYSSVLNGLARRGIMIYDNNKYFIQDVEKLEKLINSI
jgi:hypothetical protein